MNPETQGLGDPVNPEPEDEIRRLQRRREVDLMIAKMNLGVRRALREHKRLGQSIVVWDHENWKVVEVPAEEIDVPDNDDDLLAIINF